MNIIGDVKDKVCILIDDMIDTAGTITNATNALKDLGAKKCICLLYSWSIIRSCI